MSLDIRLPIGLLFFAIGVLLVCFGIFGDASIYRQSLGINVNLWWGAAMVVFGAIFLAFSRRHTAAMHPAAESVEGRAIEAREHATGLEAPDEL
jgi:hypothetical protein